MSHLVCSLCVVFYIVIENRNVYKDCQPESDLYWLYVLTDLHFSFQLIQMEQILSCY